jgi:hypothetical protein
VVGVANDDNQAAGRPGDPVGRVRPSTEPETWDAGVDEANSGSWTAQKIALALAVLLIMAGLLTFILWGAYQSA